MTARPPFAALRGRTPEDCFGRLATPCYILDEAALRQNGEILKGVADRTGAKLLLAQKAFSNYDCYPALAPYLAGTEASGLFEARLGWEILPEKEVHVFCGAYRDDEFDELLRYADHVVFNSPAQLSRLGPRAKAAGKSLGLRINPECSTQEGHAIYDPCAPGSRLGTTREQWDAKMTPDLVALLDGLHFHTLCEQDSDALEITLDAVAEKFGDVLPRMKWLNMGGGHHVTRPDYDIPRLERCIRFAQETWGVTVYLEPGEAWALNAGFLASRVLDVTENGSVKNAILDCSAACHMPDVIEMPYMPPLYGAAEGSGDDNSNVYRLGGPSCLSGDVIGDYEFDHALQIGELVLFGDLAIYSTCKNNTFNGMPLPNIWYRRADGSLEQLTDFGYRDFKYR
ncbi:MAG: carboxynorspermidine decarboxylase, partial [Oscillospiraceae bacterium]|nr:carboxynorspermidine decarboxylase [Oscillospiraceae bacterium]